MNQQQQEADRLNKELLEKRAELALLRSTLENKEMVRLTVKYAHTNCHTWTER